MRAGSPAVVAICAALLIFLTTRTCGGCAINTINDLDTESDTSASGLTWIKGGMGFEVPFFSVHSTFELPWLDWPQLPGYSINIETPMAMIYNYIMRQRALEVLNVAAMDDELVKIIQSRREGDGDQEGGEEHSNIDQASGLTWIQGGMGLHVPLFSASAKYSLPWLDWLPGYEVFFGGPHAMIYSYMTNENVADLMRSVSKAMIGGERSTLNTLRRISERIVRNLNEDDDDDEVDEHVPVSGAVESSSDSSGCAGASSSSAAAAASYPYCPPYGWCRWNRWYPPCRFCYPPPPPPPFCSYCWYYPYLPFCSWCF